MFKRGLKIGWDAIRHNWQVALVVWAAMAIMVGAYYQCPTVHHLFQWMMEIKSRGGYLLSGLANGFSTGILAEIFCVYLVQRGQWKRANIENAAFKFFILGGEGILVDAFYRFQSHCFGDGTDWITLTIKVAVDMLIFCPFLATPYLAVMFFWKNQNYCWAHVRRELQSRMGFYEQHVMPLQISTWCFWIPLVAMIYSVPLLLQMPMLILMGALWGVLIVAITR